MTREGLRRALVYSDQLPEFEDLAAATSVLTKQRDDLLAALLAEVGSALDFSRDSLKVLERWYFAASCPDTGATGYSVPRAIGFYLGEVLCRTASFGWIVRESMLIAGRYEIGVRKRLCTILLMRGRKPELEGNVRMQSLWRECGKFSD